MKFICATETIETWRIICAAQSEPNYSEDRQILMYAGADPWCDEYAVLDGGHCSCCGWDEVDFYGVVYTKDELDRLSASKIDGHGCFGESERLFWVMVRIALGLEEVER